MLEQDHRIVLNDIKEEYPATVTKEDLTDELLARMKKIHNSVYENLYVPELIQYEINREYMGNKNQNNSKNKD